MNNSWLLQLKDGDFVYLNNSNGKRKYLTKIKGINNNIIHCDSWDKFSQKTGKELGCKDNPKRFLSPATEEAIFNENKKNRCICYIQNASLEMHSIETIEKIAILLGFEEK